MTKKENKQERGSNTTNPSNIQPLEKRRLKEDINGVASRLNKKPKPVHPSTSS